MSNKKIKTILVIEDDPIHYKALKAALSIKDTYVYKLERAITPDQGLEKAYQKSHDLIICDCILQNNYNAGIELYEQFRENTTTANVPIMILTRRNLDDHYIVKNLRGRDTYFQKPYSISVIRNTIFEMINGKNDE